MSPKTSWKDVIAERQKDGFVGRKDYIKQFSENFSSDIPNYLLFFVIGEGGVGKSTLLKQFDSIGKTPEIDAIVITCDDEQSSPVASMGYIAEQLAKFDIISKDFNDRYKTYRTRRDEIESDPKAPRGALNLVVRGMTDFAIKAARRAPGIGVFAEYVDEKEAGDALTQGVNYLVDRIGNKDEIQLLREPEKTLTPLFVELLNKACEEHRLVLMFDVFERTREALEPWLLELLDFKFGEFDTGATFVISGRDTVDQRWTQIASSICYITLEPFMLEETRSYLRFRKITNKQLVAQIFEDTGGLPVLVELLAGTNPKPGSPLPDISKDAVKRFLQWIPEEERRWVALLAAVPRNFNLDTLSAVLGKNAHNDFNWLSVQSYIRTSTARGWFYHEKVRELMLRYLRKTNPGDLTKTHERLAHFFAGEQNKMELQNKNAFSSEVWRNLEVEKIYHLVCEHPKNNFKEVINAFLEAFRWRWGFAESIVQTCQQVVHETASRELQKSTQILAKFYDAYEKGEYDNLLAQANMLIKYDNLSGDAEVALFSYRAQALRHLDRHEEALRDFDRAITLDPKYAWTFVNRGLTYKQMGKAEQALLDFDHAITLDDKVASILVIRADTYQDIGKDELAIADFDHAIALREKFGTAIAGRGYSYFQMGNYDQALADFDRAIELDKNHHWAHEKRGVVLRALERYEEAIASFTQAEKTGPTCHTCVIERGKTYFQIGKHEQAIKDFDHAISLRDNSAWVFGIRGEAFSQTGEYEKAIADFDRAITLDDKYTWAIFNRGYAYQKSGSYEKAIADFDRAITLDDKYTWAIFNRGYAYQESGSYEKAIMDFDRAINLDDKNPWMISNRGYSLLCIGKYLEALADFDRAIEIGNLTDYLSHWVYEQRGITLRHLKHYEDAVNSFTQAESKYAGCTNCLSERGQTYQMLGNYDLALADFSNVVKLDEKDPLALAQRGHTYQLVFKYEEALSDFDRAIELHNKFHWAYEQRGGVLGKLKRYDEAVDSLVQAHNIEPSCSSCISQLAQIHKRMGQYEQALADYDRAVETGLDKSSAAWGQGILLRSMGDYQGAIEKFNSALLLNEKNARAFASRGETYRIMGNFEKAFSDFDRAIELDEKLDFALAFRGDLYRRQRKFDLAIKDLSLAIELDPVEDGFARSRRAVVYDALGDVTSRDADILRITESKSKESDALYHKAVMCLLSGKHEEAIEFLKNSFKEDPSEKLYAQTDDVLEPLNSLPEFQEIMMAG